MVTGSRSVRLSMSRRKVPYGLMFDQNSAVRPRRSSSVTFWPRPVGEDLRKQQRVDVHERGLERVQSEHEVPACSLSGRRALRPCRRAGRWPGTSSSGSRHRATPSMQISRRRIARPHQAAAVNCRSRQGVGGGGSSREAASSGGRRGGRWAGTSPGIGRRRRPSVPFAAQSMRRRTSPRVATPSLIAVGALAA